ncbi:hypothetical protein FKW77_007853 [Venturia effusa]|uniref:Chromatin structure-remodeling complex protein rsc7 n=1 Tax=Venturia effusa TaxID=50376 RepID=A0A517LFY8_9PEZI|nr:hypothetical protein FKW77_007853 [Venturia effusa]
MYSSMSHHHSQSLNGSPSMESTINPAALGLNTPVQPPNHSTSNLTQSSPRGVKRSRSPEIQGESLGYDRTDDDDLTKPRKRGRPPKSKALDSPVSTTHSIPPSTHQPVQTPQLPTQPLPQQSPSQGSPAKTPTKTAVVKALPTVRDHTTDQLNPEGDEYIPREFDENGEKKIAANGRLQDGREYKCRTFFVPNRGDKLFMLATECARVLSYRDSYLLFNKNRSLYKIIANQTEKDDLIQQEILPYSYRSRQIAIVTAKSMFRQFGSRVIQGGRRVRDDYWEAKARKQGFTEEDAAGEKRPGAQKAREAAAAAESAHVASLTLPQGQIIYSSATEGHIPSSALASQHPYEDMRPDFSSVQRPRQELSGQAYQDRISPSAPTEILTHAQQTAEFNRTLVQQRANRARYLDDIWQKPHEPAVLAGSAQVAEEGVPASSQAVRSPQVPTAGASLPGTQTAIPHQQQGIQQMLGHQYPQQTGPQSLMAQSPVRPMNTQIPGSQMHQRSPGMVAHPQQNAYAYQQQQNQMWHQAQPSPMGQPQHPGMQYGQHMPSQSPHMQPSPMHAPPQLHHSSSTGSMQGTPIGYPGMSGMNPPGYPNVQQRQQMYQQASSSPHHYMQQSSAAVQPGMQGWAPPPQQQQHQQQHGQQPGWQQGF